MLKTLKSQKLANLEFLKIEFEIYSWFQILFLFELYKKKKDFLFF